MTGKRDSNWLVKAGKEPISGYYIHENDRIAKTIESEIKILFPHIVPDRETQAQIVLRVIQDNALGEDGYEITSEQGRYRILGTTSRALLYGMYGLHRILTAKKQPLFPVRSIPDQHIRMLNHWDNFDGSIERGYAGESIFYENDQFRQDPVLLRQYARLLASIGINALSINNVNVHKKEAFFIAMPYLREIKQIADIFQEYGIKMFLSIHFAAPIHVGGLDTADPNQPEVAAWWEQTAKQIYDYIPWFGGFLVKADSEGEPGPFTYGRNHDDGANMLARAVAPFGGLIIWRCFVYNCQQDWRDRSTDRAKAQYDTYMGLDGAFDDNVILQIKNGPIDFQVREPVSPLLGALRKTNQILEYQITQEYTGQQKHIFYLVPMWKTILNCDTGYDREAPCVCDLLGKHSSKREHSGIAAVVNVGMDQNWTGHKLAQANLYGFGRMIWDNQLSSEAILDEWMELTFQLSQKGQDTLKKIMMTSAKTYEDYSAPHGIGFMVQPHHHYGPAVDGYEYDRWGTYHFADRQGIGVDRTLATGTGYTRQYADKVFEQYENIHTCPDELLLFFHHVPYEFVLQSGKTLIQSIYDTHFAGVLQVMDYEKAWEALKPEVEEKDYENVRERLQEQLANAREWCDQINTYFYRKSGIMDEQGRKIYQ